MGHFVSKHRNGLGLALGAGLLLGAGQAHANIVAGSTHYYTDGDTWGNDNIGMNYSWLGTTIQNPQGSADKNMSIHSGNLFLSIGTLFGRGFIPLMAESAADGEHYRVSSPEYSHTETIGVTLAGTSLINKIQKNVPCTAGAFYGCASFTKSISKTFWSDSKTFMIGILPVTVSGGVSGSMNAGLNSTAWALTDDLLPGSMNARSFAKMTAGASINVHTSASMGIPYVAQVGVGADVTLLAVSTGPVMSASMVVDPVGANIHGNYSWDNTDTIDVTTLSGTVTVFAKLFGGTIGSTTLVSWNGYNWNGTWVADKGTTTF